MKKKLGQISFFIITVMLIARSGSAIDTISDVGHFSRGAGLTSANIDSDPRPDLIFSWVDAPDGSDTIYYRVAKNVDWQGNASWGTRITAHNPGNETDGVGVSAGDINENGTVDLIFVSIDDPDGENNVRYRIAWDVDSDGVSGSWTGLKVIESSEIHVGAETAYSGASLTDLDFNGKLDLVVAWADNPNPGDATYPDDFYYVVIWNLDDEGYYASISDRFEVKSDWHPANINGIGLEMVNLDENPQPEFVFSIIDDPAEDNVGYYLVAWNMDSNATSEDWGNWTSFTTNTGYWHEGMGLAVTKLDNHTSFEFINAAIDSPSGANAAYFYPNFNMEDDNSRGVFKTLETTKRPEIISHAGKVIAVVRQKTEHVFYYSIMKDDESWTSPEKIQFPNMTDDLSVMERVAGDAPFTYLYNSESIPVKTFRLFSDGKYLYLFRASDSGELYADRFIVDIATHSLERPYDIRFRRTGKKCERHAKAYDTPGYKDMDNNVFYEPTVQFRNISSVKDFDIAQVPTNAVDEMIWQIFSLNSVTGQIDVTGYRKAKDDYCYLYEDENGTTSANHTKNRVFFQGLFDYDDKRVVYQKSDDVTDDVTIPGVSSMQFFPTDIGLNPPAGSDWFIHGPTVTIYNNQQNCDGETVKTSQRLMVVVSNHESRMVSINFAMTRNGTISDLSDIRSVYTDPYDSGECTTKVEGYTVVEELYEKVQKTPYLYEGSDGFIHLIYQNQSGVLWERIYDPLDDIWLDENDTQTGNIAGGVNHWFSDGSVARNPVAYYPLDLNQGATAVEYGGYRYDSDNNITGLMKRGYLFAENDNVYFSGNEKVGDLDLKYIGQNIINPTLIGFIEGAPPVPRENLTEEDDYNDITSVEIVSADSISHSYSNSEDKGIDFEFEWKGFGIGAKIETSYGWLSENSVSSERVDMDVIKQGLTGRWNSSEARWDPHNIGLAVLKAKKADVYALSLKDSNRMFSYKTVPVEGSESEYLTPFVMNPRYKKNGTLDGRVGSENDPDYDHLKASEKGSYYRDEELKDIEDRIKNREARIASFYKKYNSNAFQSVPQLNSISRRDIINEYDWTATAGSRSQTTSFATSMSESLGGSFSFLGMGGAAWEGGIGSEYETSILLGGHYESNFMKTEESSSSFELNVESEVEKRNVVTAGLEPIASASKVDYFKWKTVYLSADSDNFDDFYDRVVDPEWLQKNSVHSNRLRQARNRSNKVWSIRHFVTFVSRLYAIE